MGGEGEKGTRDDAQVLLPVTAYMVVNKVWDVGGEASVGGEITNVGLDMLGLLGKGQVYEGHIALNQIWTCMPWKSGQRDRADILP